MVEAGAYRLKRCRDFIGSIGLGSIGLGLQNVQELYPVLRCEAGLVIIYNYIII